ncbi:hypothetical protein ACOBQX_30185 [Actinokineospora sp. G85]|uniref:hypothetical protein n=1 Tax=Actinokineospora sp. G85 TaxID=3406626 RepID=UPI003C7474DB
MPRVRAALPPRRRAGLPDLLAARRRPVRAAADPRPGPGRPARLAAQRPGARAGGDPAAAAFARPPVELPDPPPLPDSPPAAVSVPPAPGVDPAVVEMLVADAAARARAALLGDPVPDYPLWPDTVRWAAAHPAAHARIGSGVDRAVAAWRAAGDEGLDVLEHPWSPPATTMAHARDALVHQEEGVAAEPGAVWRNRWTSGAHQLRYSREGRWHPYREREGQWWPAGPAQRDPVAALQLLQS